MRATLVCLLLSVVAIASDLQSDIDDVVSQLPMKEIESIGKQYVAAYPSYAQGLRYMGKVTYVQLVRNFLQTKEGQQYRAYFTHRGIDVESILLHLTQMTMDINRKWLEPIRDGELIGSAITGNIMADYKKAISASGFPDAVLKMVQASPEFANLVAAIKDPKYHALFYNVVNSKGLGGYGKVAGAEVRGFWQWVWEAVKVVAVASVILG